ncbi:hypothetical protein LI328DRAFT_139441 [Trichoderma asperelloides]|nr:hypothetical protein LI328DRAFT_139441 [Trichoderma asperelloides]
MIQCESVAPVSSTLSAQALRALIDKPSHAGRSCRILGRPETTTPISCRSCNYEGAL